MIKKLQLLFIVLPFIMSLQAKEYRINSSSTFSSALSSIKPGDTITIVNGTYNNWSIAFNANGDSTHKILLRAETLNGVILTGTSMLKIGGKYLVVDGLMFTSGYVASGNVIEFRNSSSIGSSYCRLTNTSIVDYSNPDTTIDSKWVSLYGNNNRVDHCYLKGKRNLGTTLVVWVDSTAPGSWHEIDSNYFALRPELGLNGGETIRVGTSEVSQFNSFTTVEYNLFEECNGEIECISNKSCGNVYRYNTFVSCQGTLTLRHGNRCSVYGNFFFANHKPNSGGIRIIGEDHVVYNNYVSGCSGNSMKSALTMMDGIPNSVLSGYFQVKRAVVAFNTFVDNIYNFNIGAVGTGSSLPPIDCVVANNIIYGKSDTLVQFTTAPTNMTWQGNIIYGAPTGFSSFPANNFNVNPNLAAADANGVIHLSSTSPAIDKAMGTFAYVATDIDGDTRGTLKDIGCDEYPSSTPKIKPMKASDVGPRSTVTDIKNSTTGSIDRFQLFQNYPNPFNPSTTIRYTIPHSGKVVVTVFNALGKEVKELVNMEQQAGEHMTIFSAEGLSSGVYYYALRCGEFTSNHKMILLK